MDDSTDQFESTSVKYRLTGALFWLGLMVIIVPSWYSHPVHFDPEQTSTKPVNSTGLIEKPFVLPKKNEGQAKSIAQTVQKHSVETDTRPNSKSKSKSMVTDASKAVPSNQTPSNQSISTDSTPVNWVIQLVAYKTKTMADTLQERLKYDYDAFVKFFPKNGYYSVRVGPYQDKTRALKDQERLNQLLRIDSILIKGQFKKINE